MKFFEPILWKRLFQKLMRSKIKIEVKNYSSSVRRVGSARHRKEQVSESSETEIESDVTAPAPPPPPQSVSTQSHAEGVQGTKVAHAAQALMLGQWSNGGHPPILENPARIDLFSPTSAF